MRFAQNIVELVGDTPLVRLSRIGAGLRPLLLAKLELLNPGGSVKDRIGLGMIEDAERRGLLRPGGTIVEPTSGNTGVGLAMAAAIKGYRLVCTMPDKMSQEKRDLLRAYGAEVVICPTAVPPESPESYYRVADRLAQQIPGAFQPNQYYNPENPEAHYRTTGPEIWEQTEGRITHLVAGVGTGGTVSGAGKYLKERSPKDGEAQTGQQGTGQTRVAWDPRKVHLPRNHRCLGIASALDQDGVHARVQRTEPPLRRSQPPHDVVLVPAEILENQVHFGFEVGPRRIGHFEGQLRLVGEDREA